MSWFDAAGLASIAKSALKEAQKTIDKALDIKDSDFTSTPTNTPVDTNDDFFGTWGLAQTSGVKNEVVNKVDVAGLPGNVSASLWGSFTGSFFETQKENRSHNVLSNQEGGIVDKSSGQHSQSESDVQGKHDNVLLIDVQNTAPIEEGGQSNVNEEGTKNTHLALIINEEYQQLSTANTADFSTNRISGLSESGKNSSESVEILSGDTGCTTSPDSDAFSISTPSSLHGTKHISESVEILPDSLTSPSSLEILGFDSNLNSQHSDDFVSPLASPHAEPAISNPLLKDSPDSVCVIPEEPDEISIAEDASYTSASEHTAVTVLESVFSNLKPQKPLKEVPLFEAEIEVKNARMEPIVLPPARSNMLLPDSMRLIDTQPQSSNQDLLNLIKNQSNVIDIPQDESTGSTTEVQQEVKDDEGSKSDRTMVGSLETTMESSSDTSTIEGTSSSCYVKAMLADAMTEKGAHSEIQLKKSDSFMEDSQELIDLGQNSENVSEQRREPSPLSSESLVKIGSDHASGHTSGDEVETNTSSDIEIISSPNGDSSSTQSRQSPAKQCSTKYKHNDANVDVLLGKMTFKKVRGHNRELSEASSISDDSHSSEVDRLLRRVSEMTEILELRESKLIEMNRRNAELQEANSELRRQLDIFLMKQSESADLTQVTEEYTQRLSALEKKFQQAIRDKDSLRKQLEQSKQEASAKVSKTEINALIVEKDETITQLREEGEKLSKQQLQHSNIIKKLRAKEKEQESVIKNLSTNVEELSSETERLKRSLAAKDEVERSQIEAIHQLTAKNKKMENEINVLKEQLDDLTQKYETLKKSHEAAKRELIDKNKASSELLAREQLVETLENEKRVVESQKEQILNQLDDLRLKLREADHEFLRKEQLLRAENSDLLHRVEDAERRNEELSQTIMEVSKPLVKQLEVLQSTHSKKIAGFEKSEQALMAKSTELQAKLKTATENEKLSRDECIKLERKVLSLEQQLNSALHEIEMLKVKFEEKGAEKMLLEQDLSREINSLQQQFEAKKEECDVLVKEVDSLRLHLAEEKHANEADRNDVTISSQDVSEKSDALTEPVKEPTPNTRSTSPTISLGKASLSESISSNWLSDDQFELGSAPNYTNMFEMQMLQTNLKQREGELQQLHWEMNRREQERKLLNSQIASLLSRIEDLESKLKELEGTKVQFEELNRQYDTLCQLYGEKVEENEELKLDLQDVKEMYKSQIDELLEKQKQ